MIWWLLAPHPFAVLADAAPVSPPRRDRLGNPIGDPLDPLGELGNEIRGIRNPDWDRYDNMLLPAAVGPTGVVGFIDEAPTVSVDNRARPSAAVWPWGLAFHGLLTLGAVSVTIRRLRAPTRKLGRGVRIA